MAQLRYRTEYAAIRLIGRLGGYLPYPWMLGLGTGLGELGFWVVRKRRTTTLANLYRAFDGTLRGSALRRLGRAVYHHWGRAAIEYLWLQRHALPPECRITVVGADHLRWAQSRGRGGVLVTGHFGQWELLGATVVDLGYSLSVVVKPQHNPYLDRLINHCRSRVGLHTIAMNQAPRQVMKVLRSNQFVGILADQDAGPGGVFVQFMGRPASTYSGPAIFALRMGTPIIPCFMVRLSSDHYQAIIETPICTPDPDQRSNPGASHSHREALIRRYTQAYTAVLERYVRAYPEQWWWLHRRWKTRPP